MRHLLWDEGKVPVWTNMSVCGVTVDKTVIELFFSRRFQNDEELNHKVSQYPPFSIGMSFPPGTLKLEEGQKIDINWKQLTKRRGEKGFISILRSLFKSIAQDT